MLQNSNIKIKQAFDKGLVFSMSSPDLFLLSITFDIKRDLRREGLHEFHTHNPL